MVRMRGLEPPQDYSHYHLKVARLPFRHIRVKYHHIVSVLNQKLKRSLTPGQVVVEVVLAVVGANEGFHVILGGAKFDAGIEGAIGVEDLLNFV